MDVVQLKEGHYGFKVTVVGKKHEFGTSFVNVTVHPRKGVCSLSSQQQSVMCWVLVIVVV